jgi:hypothetical protein
MIKKVLISLILIQSVCSAYTITHNDYSSGGSVSAAGQNTNENAIVNVINGNIDTTNIAANGVGTTQIAAQAVTAAKIANNTITDTQITANGLTGNVDFTSGTVQGTSANSSGNQGSIKQGTISTPDFRTNAVSTATLTSNASGLTASWIAVSTASITTLGGGVLVFGSCEVYGTANASGIFQGGVGVCQDTINAPNCFFTTNAYTTQGQNNGSGGFTTTVTGLFFPSAGAHKYGAYYILSAGSSPTVNCHVLALELRS